VSFPYVISHEKLNLYITVLDISSLYLHEETIPEILDQLAQSIKKDGCLKHPVIVDGKTHVVLDGMHRVAALEKLGYARIPVCLVDYENPTITVGCWYRTIKGDKALEQNVTQPHQVGLTFEKVNEVDDRRLGVSSVVAAMKGQEKAFLVCSPFRNLKEAYDIIKRIEERLKTSGFEVAYETELDALSKLRRQDVDAVLLTPKLTKSAIISTALSGSVFSYKATRHVIPARPLDLDVPLSLLKDDKKSLEAVNEEMRRMLQKRRLRRVAAGSVLKGRRYEEDLYLFEE